MFAFFPLYALHRVPVAFPAMEAYGEPRGLQAVSGAGAPGGSGKRAEWAIFAASEPRALRHESQQLEKAGEKLI